MARWLAYLLGVNLDKCVGKPETPAPYTYLIE
jgi:hypothetical protein